MAKAMMKICLVNVMLLPALLWAQEFPFHQEQDSIPLLVEGWQPFQPWGGGTARPAHRFVTLMRTEI